MYTNRPTYGASSSARNAQIAAMHRECARELQRRVARRARADPQTIEDACSHAWLQLLTQRSVDLASPDRGALGWLTQTATREAWRRAPRQVRDGLLDPATTDGERRLRGPLGPTADELADQHARLDLVGQIPPRPRRFLLRVALGYSYREIAASRSRAPSACCARVTHTTSRDGVARARPATCASQRRSTDCRVGRAPRGSCEARRRPRAMPPSR